eukprot:CAMPEP_0119034260 /NCGR_PEP_ID=MMETSP1177-20130426/1263_1 /TAXON_ID=2985 /ORGANISM="Ochromonas sp, Strain CCMP1899" /LENGTH=628 /DNA_ID=CAMNT_0006991571 /DNA_START=191 /DNA_END=2073 /DNA_ORIENTATION=+
MNESSSNTVKIDVASRKIVTTAEIDGEIVTIELTQKIKVIAGPSTKASPRLGKLQQSGAEMFANDSELTKYLQTYLEQLLTDFSTNDITVGSSNTLKDNASISSPSVPPDIWPENLSIEEDFLLRKSILWLFTQPENQTPFARFGAAKPIRGLINNIKDLDTHGKLPPFFLGYPLLFNVTDLTRGGSLALCKEAQTSAMQSYALRDDPQGVSDDALLIKAVNLLKEKGTEPVILGQLCYCLQSEVGRDPDGSFDQFLKDTELFYLTPSKTFLGGYVIKLRDFSPNIKTKIAKIKLNLLKMNKDNKNGDNIATDIERFKEAQIRKMLLDKGVKDAKAKEDEVFERSYEGKAARLRLKVENELKCKQRRQEERERMISEGLEPEDEGVYSSKTQFSYLNKEDVDNYIDNHIMDDNDDNEDNGVRWTCCQCTMINEGYAIECDMCGLLLADNIAVEIEEVVVDKPWRCRQCTLWNEAEPQCSACGLLWSDNQDYNERTDQNHHNNSTYVRDNHKNNNDNNNNYNNNNINNDDNYNNSYDEYDNNLNNGKYDSHNYENEGGVKYEDEVYIEKHDSGDNDSGDNDENYHGVNNYNNNDDDNDEENEDVDDNNDEDNDNNNDNNENEDGGEYER